MAQQSTLEKVNKDIPGVRSYDELINVLELDNVRVAQPAQLRKKPLGKAAVVGGAANDPAIFESQRNVKLTRLAGQLRRAGYSEEEIEGLLQARNQRSCSPPLDREEVARIARSIGRYAPADQDGIGDSLHDTGNAARFAFKHHETLRYVPSCGWLMWDDVRWVWDGTDHVQELAKGVANDIWMSAEGVVDQTLHKAVRTHAKTTHQLSRIKAMIELARSDPRLVVLRSRLDEDPLLFGVAHGVIDLRTGAWRKTRREDFITRGSGVVYDAKAKCPLFLEFLKTVFRSDKDLIGYIQRVFGYSLTGQTSEQCFFFFHGQGANGKSTLLNVLKALVGEYAVQMNAESFMAVRGGGSGGAGPSSDMARLAGPRVAVVSEVEENTHLAEGKIKALLGGEAFTARQLYKEPFEFVPQVKLFFAGNHKPVIQGTDLGIWRRVQLVPFDVRITAAQRDPQLFEKLRSELPGILNWALKGCRNWQASGLRAPKIVVDAVEEYRSDMDLMGKWLEDSALVSPVSEWGADPAYQSYKFWAERNSYKPMTAANFGRKLVQRFERVKRSSGNVYIGVGPRQPAFFGGSP